METKPFLDFWYNFDLIFNPTFGQVSSVIMESYSHILSLPVFWLGDRSFNGGRNYPDNFIDRVRNSEEITDSLKLLGKTQLDECSKLIDSSGDINNLQTAFELFGQGILYDNYFDVKTFQPRRPDNEKVHMMDVLNVGYPRWYVFCRAAVAAGLEYEFWITIARLVSIAFSLHSTLKPKQSKNGKDPQNICSPSLAKECVSKFQSNDFDSLDELFDTPEIRTVFGVPLVAS